MALTAGSIEIKLFADIARLQSDMNKANKTVDGAMNNIEKSVNVAKKAFASLVGVVSVGQIIKLADEYKRFDSQLKLSTKTLDDYNMAYSRVVNIARTSQSDIGAIGVLYSRLTNNLREFGTSQSAIGDISESIALSLRVSNATVQETNSVMLQLSQSFGSGKINGQEFLAVAEGAPMILRQLAKSMGVSYGALKDLSSQGKLTAQELQKALSDPAYLAGLREQVKQVGTISSSITVLMNNLKQFIGETDKGYGASKVFAQGIMLLADSINVLAGVAIVVAIRSMSQLIVKKYELIQTTLAEAAATRAKAAGDLAAANAQLLYRNAQLNAITTTNASTVALSNNAMASTLAGKASANVAAAQTAVGIASAKAATGASLFKNAIALLGGPIGATIVAAGSLYLGIGKLIEIYNSSESQANATSRAFNGVADSINNVEVAASSSSTFTELMSNYKKYETQLNSFAEQAKKGNTQVQQIIPQGSKLGDFVSKSYGNIGEVSDAIKQIKINFDEFAKTNPLKDATSQAQDYAQKLAIVNAAFLAGELDSQTKGRYLAQLKEEYEKATGAIKEQKKAVKELSEAKKEANAQEVKRLNIAIWINEQIALEDKKKNEEAAMYAEKRMQIEQQRADDNYKAAQDAATNSTKIMDEAYKELKNSVDGYSRDMARSLAQFAMGGKVSFADMIDSMLLKLLEFANQKLIFDPLFKSLTQTVDNSNGLDGLLGSIAGGITGLFNGGVSSSAGAYSIDQNPYLNFDGFRAAGGSVAANKSYVVGEKGAEMFVPSTSGTIIPNHKMGGNNVVINVVEAQGTKANVQQQQNADGSMSISVIVEQLYGVMNRDLQKGSGIAPTLERRYGLNRLAGA